MRDLKSVSNTHEMHVNGLTCTLHMPPALKGEKVHDLPPRNPRLAYPVDEYPACPSNWMHGSDLASSYFVGVREGEGMWLDFNGCSTHSHHVAIVISIQGVNPISGPLVDPETGDPKMAELLLHHYTHKCPNHDVPFQQDRYCPECDHKWPKQNYITTTSTPIKYLWLDGFRNDEGKVRQYILTAEELKSIAHQTIGEEKKVFAIGIAFYLSKERKPEPPKPERKYDFNPALEPWQESMRRRNKAWIDYNKRFGTKGGGGMSSGMTPPLDQSKLIGYVQSSHTHTGQYSEDDIKVISGLEAIKKRPGMYKNTTEEQLKKVIEADIQEVQNMLAEVANEPNLSVTSHSTFDMDDGEAHATLQGLHVDGDEHQTAEGIYEPDIEEVQPDVQLEVGAGAQIDQQVHADPESLDFYQDKPAGMIYINYVSEATALKIITKGKRQHKPEGFMQGLKVGN